MIIDLGAQNTFGRRLLQFVEQAVLIENLLRIAAIQKLVQRVFPDCHSALPQRHYDPAHVLTVRIKIDLPFEPGLTASHDIGAILLGRVRGLFLRVIL
jgi:hypothetical protein